jgi:hypothetical protein
MKNIFIATIFFLIYNNLFGQNYQLYNPGQVQYFVTSSPAPMYQAWSYNNFYQWSDIKALIFDSVSQTSNARIDTSFHCFVDTVTMSFSQCTPYLPAWHGGVFYVNPDTSFTFNIYGDTVWFFPKLPVGASWNFLTHQNGYIIATVDTILLGSINSFQDSLKYISLFAFDSSGNQIISHPVNGQQIIISENYGFKKTVAIRDLPDLVATLDRIPNITTPLFDQVYDFNVGDVFENYYSSHNYIPFPTVNLGRTEITILGKNIDTLNQSVSYSRRNCISSFNLVTCIFDTVSYPYNSQPIFPGYPEQFINGKSYIIKDSTMCGLAFGYSVDYYFSNDSCIYPIAFDAPVTTYMYEAGLGLIYYYHSDQSRDTINETNYFRKTNDSCGVFHDITTNISKINFTKVQISPVPASDFIKILWELSGSGTNSIAEIYNCHNQIVKIAKVVNGINEIAIDELPQGYYFVLIQCREKIYNGKLIKIE